MAKGLDGTFLNYGIRKDDMEIVQRVCEDDGVDFEWVKEEVLRCYQDRKNNNIDMEEEKEVSKLLKQALKSINN
ncbi:MAG: hypothetical protein MJZ33_10905 [Paludibacteraceae bacterium]|nr:hypothetical protein [Paludibacteraceae bacterium]